MPVYNCEDYIREAIDSILVQTISDFELIIIDDASTDKTVDIIKTFKDERIRLIEKETNTGYPRSLNMGLNLARGEYIARMDGDDISMSQRFEKQIEFFNKNSSLVACSSNYMILDSQVKSNHPVSPEKTKVYLLSGCYVAHPAVMIKREALVKNGLSYNPEYEPAEDYNLWISLIKFGEIANIEEALLYYRTHDLQVSKTRSEKQMKYANHARLRMLGYLFEDGVSPEEQEVHLSLMRGTPAKAGKRQMVQWIKKLIERNAYEKIFDQCCLEDFLRERLQIYLGYQEAAKVPLSKRINWKARHIAKTTLHHLGLNNRT